MKKYFFLLTSILSTALFAQDFSSCKIDLSAFVPQEKFQHLIDDGKEVVLIKENLPNYNKPLVKPIILTYFIEKRQATDKEIKKYQKYLATLKNNINSFFTVNGKFIDQQEIPYFINDTTIIKGTAIYSPKSKKIERDGVIYFLLTKTKKIDSNPGLKASDQEMTSFLHSCNINLSLSSYLKKGNDLDTVIIPIASDPIFDFSFFDNKKIFVDYPYSGKSVKFKTDGYSIGYVSFGNSNVENLISVIFLRASKFNQINNRMAELLKEKITIIDKQGNVTQVLQLKSIVYNYADACNPS